MHLLLLLPACFLPPRTQAEETIRGCESRPHSRPYMAHLKFSDKDFQYICSGFLIQEDFVLTAAHCNEHSVTVILGCHNTSKYEKTQQIIPVSRAIPHPDYDSKSYANDIMLLKGDSGGPLVCKNVAQGIISYGKKSGKPPMIYTNISSFLPWIKKTMKRGGD
ncbi:granzyme B(G,H)-like [Erinaceus europaeus]|uniref:Granzyme B(G,H)-like n=1 Tax=Erinaceus europaeus TaxID=9365 RepID=A0ABM3W0P0_ERIEU|nr:granzyme B(G,H)-like [Erinaceus europaeus]